LGKTIFGLFVEGCGEVWDFGGIDSKTGRQSLVVGRGKGKGFNAEDAEDAEEELFTNKGHGNGYLWEASGSYAYNPER
jgi:hypothetical protein